MRARFMTSVAGLLGTIVLASSLPAQSPLRFELSGGATPTARDRGYDIGTHLQVALEREHTLGRLGLRADAFVHAFRRETYNGPLSPHTTIAGGLFSLVLPLGSPTASLRPYLLAGAGTYQVEYGGGQHWTPGFSGGGGVRFQLGPVGAFVETRVHQIEDSSTPRLLPVSFGVRF